MAVVTLRCRPVLNPLASGSSPRREADPGHAPHAGECSNCEQAPIPALPRCDVCFATEFFEHVYDPVAYLDRFHQALNSGGLLITDVSDHESEFMHVSPKLERLRQRIAELGFEEIRPLTLFRKTAG